MSQKIVGYIEYTAQCGDMYDSIALSAYNQEQMASVIIEFNPDMSDVIMFEGGEQLKIPIVDSIQTSENLPPWRR